MIQDLRVLHREYSTARSFEEVVTAFEVAVGTLEAIGVPSIVASSKDVAGFERSIGMTRAARHGSATTNHRH